MSSQKQVNKSKFLFGLSRWHLKTTGRAIYRSKVKLEVLKPEQTPKIQNGKRY
jgi:hypothetical protein